MLPETDLLLNECRWLQIVDKHNFDDFALAIFRHQYRNNNLYRDYVDALKAAPENVKAIQQVPFLPVSFFKTHTVLCGQQLPELFFESSGTTGMQNSRHYIHRPELYKESFLRAFEQFYGAPEDYVFICLLPSYLERQHSSLVFMAEELIRQSRQKESGFYLYDWGKIIPILQQNHSKKIFLLGVTFALLDFAEAHPMNLEHVIVMETGGMKGRREEWTRDEVHTFLKEQWNLPVVHSEYGMTELLSQGYSKGGGIFQIPEWMRVLARDENDPFDIKATGTGGLNIIDLANIDSCSFIATEDIVKIREDKSFEVMGRLDHSALRGCSLMMV